MVPTQNGGNYSRVVREEAVEVLKLEEEDVRPRRGCGGVGAQGSGLPTHLDEEAVLVLELDDVDCERDHDEEAEVVHCQRWRVAL
jgi:hypothetical protein